jgi:methylase of polypeptide subunit release factors
MVLWIKKTFDPDITTLIRSLFESVMKKWKLEYQVVGHTPEQNLVFPLTNGDAIDEERFESISSWLNCIFLAFRNPDHQSTIGQVFTPYIFVKQINERVIELSRENSINGQDLQTICDFACGPGHFINYYLWKRLQAGFSNKKLSEVFTQFKATLFAYDIDPAACFATFSTAIMLCLSYIDQNKLNGAIPRLIETDLLPPIEIYKQDFLQPNFLAMEHYNIIIGNPPYIFSRDLPVSYRQQLSKWNYKAAAGQYDLSDVFIEQAINLLTPGGHLGIIIPEAIQTLENRKNIRSTIIKKSSKLELTHIVTPFAQKSVSNLILFIEKNSFANAENIESRMIRIKINNDNPIEFDYKTLLQTSRHSLIPRSSSLQDALHWIEQNYHSIEEWNTNHPEDPFLLFRGVELSKKGTVMQCPSCLKWMPFSTTRLNCIHCDQPLSKNNVIEHSILQKIDGKTGPLDTNHAYFLNSFGISNPENGEKEQMWVTPSHVIDLTYDGIQYKDAQNYSKTRIIVRQLLQKGQICAKLASSDCYTSQSIYNIIPPTRFAKDQVQFELLLTWIRANHVSFYNFHTFSKGKDLFARILLGKLKQLPWIPRNPDQIPTIPLQLQEIIK